MLQRLRQWCDDKQRVIALVILALLAIAGAGFAYKLFFHRAPATGIYSAAAPASGMSGAPTHTTVPVPLKAYDKKQAGKLMAIPDVVLADPKLEITGTARLKPSPGGYTAAAVTNTTTGETTIITKEEKRPFFGFLGQTEIGARGGISTGGQQGAIYARQDLLRLGSVNLAGYAEANASAIRSPEAKAMLDVSIRW